MFPVFWLFASHAKDESDDDDCLAGELNEILHLTLRSFDPFNGQLLKQLAGRALAFKCVSKLIVWFFDERKQLTGWTFKQRALKPPADLLPLDENPEHRRRIYCECSVRSASGAGLS
ncbi:hypothetical protein EV13_1986 [Prochlorococcus sp. MIT 0702]|uniref:hypothetical protein n=1 Tax=Prochlorococcus sp. MIT 0703 TaxID=1499504 RepID=UPI000533A5F0|nr:hypothetical protein [Prochlorococcus sp. MIT 0703]KGG27584.1 hypothetical protein EV13_1986 [Prochlorococcus sp. MIT 0702]